VEESGTPSSTDGPQVTSVFDGDTARLTVVGEFTEPARRPLVRALTDLLLAESGLHRVELDLRGTTFLNSAGLSVLVQLQRLGRPRGVEVVLVDPPESVIRPLQLSGLWHRFPVIEGPLTDGNAS
jgi:stage II sporulation protein AA (anti-sigma F factor antagonist)